MNTPYSVAFLVIVMSQVTYQLAQKSVPSALQPFAALTLAYALATVVCLIIAAFMSDFTVLAQLRASFVAPVWVLALAVVGIEAGFLFLYRAGGAVSTAYATTSAGTVTVLFAIGLVFLHEPLTAKKLLGVALATTGTWLATSSSS